MVRTPWKGKKAGLDRKLNYDVFVVRALTLFLWGVLELE